MANSHKRDTDARRNFRLPSAPYVAGGLAVLATLSSVGVGVLVADPQTRDVLLAGSTGNIAQAAADDQAAAPRSDAPLDRQPVVSRSAGDRIVREEPWEDLLEKQAVARAVRTADDKVWTTAPLNLWVTPGDDAPRRGVLDDSTKVLATGREAAGRVEIVVEDQARWVTSGYLTDENPAAQEAEETEESTSSSGSGSGTAALGGACANGTSVEGQPNILEVHEAVCAAFPEITSYGTYRSDGEHAQGLAIDIMVSGDRGWEVAEFVRSHSSELGVNYVMYSQRIWSVDRSGEGWRYVEDRGSATANHYDHVHVTTY